MPGLCMPRNVRASTIGRRGGDTLVRAMGARRRSKSSASKPSTASDGPPILLIDAGLAAGWRRAEPDLEQLDEVVAVARKVVGDSVVLADASLKWSLPEDQREQFERYRATSLVLCAPGGTRGGHHAFLTAAAQAAADQGRQVYLLSGLDIGEGPWRHAMLRRPDGQWHIELPGS